MPLPRLPARGLLLLLLALVFLPALAAQESSWDGNAAVVRKGEFDSPGLFAASDSFPQGTLLRVENPQNGKAVQVTVVDRINGRGNVFLLLSEQAAAVLGLSPSEVIRVKARVLIASIDSARAGSREPAASPDPDVNPAAAVAAALPEAAAAKSEATEAPAEAAAAAAEPVAAVGAPAPELPAEAPPEEPPSEAVTPPAGTALEVSTATASAPEAQPEAPAADAAERRLKELTARIPQKRLFQPPPESSAVAPEPAIAAAPAEEIAIEETVPPVEEEPEGGSLSALPPEPAAQSEALPEGEVPEEPPVAEMAPLPAEATLTEQLPLAEAAVEEEPAEATPSLSVSPEPVPAPEPAIAAPATPVLQEPPPEPATAAPRVAAVPSTAAETPAAETLSLARRSFYLQLGAYSTRGLAEKLAREVSSYARYTVAVLPSSTGARPLYKVLIGPLNRDESGTLLYQFRARGFRDAFLQYIE